jgi:hypothetical protein
MKMATKKSTAVMKWDEELAKQAEIAAAMEESTASGQFFSLKGGILSWNDAPVPNNHMGVIILDSILENVYYEGEYDPEVPQSPTCYAFGRDDKTIKPHQNVVDAGNSMAGASGLCNGCEMNEWGSADRGKGKACRNSRRLALIPAGNFNQSGKFELTEEAEHFETASVGFMKLPVTSIKGYASFVKQIAEAMKRPPHGVVTKIKVMPDPKNQFKVTFEPLMTVPNSVMGAIMKRHKDMSGLIEFPYSPPEEETGSKPKKGAKPTGKKQVPAPAKNKKTTQQSRRY